MSSRSQKEACYGFIDVELQSRRIIGWGTESKSKVEVELTAGYHRFFLTAGQYNKLIRKLRK